VSNWAKWRHRHSVLRDLPLRLCERLTRIFAKGEGYRHTEPEIGKHLSSETVRFTAERKGGTYRLDLGKAGLSTDSRRRLSVNANLQTEGPHVYADGDVVGFPPIGISVIGTGTPSGLSCRSHSGQGTTELVHIGQAILSMGCTSDYFLESVFNYPALSEAQKMAELDGSNRLNAS